MSKINPHSVLGKFLLAIFLITGIGFSTIFAASDFPAIDPDAVIVKYGTPDIVDSTAYDKPRPPMVTKWFIYKKENVRIIFMADAPFGSPPPYKVWRLIGAMDAQGKKILEPDDFKKRMSKRIQR